MNSVSPTTLEVVRYATGQAAIELGKNEDQVRILAQRLSIQPPFTEAEMELMRSQIKPDASNDSTANAEDLTAPLNDAPLAPPQPQLSPAMVAMCDEMQAQAIDLMTAEMKRRWPDMQRQVLEGLLNPPKQQ